MAYNTLGPIWPDGSTIVMQLELGPTSVTLEDGLGTWDGSAANALAAWNPYMEVVQFDSVSNSQAPKAPGDGISSVFFSDSVYGENFGEDVLGITLLFYDEDQRLTAVEADVIVNNAFHFNSYRGPLKAGDAETRLYDIHRVFLHEFGHVLGLAHPDEIGQLVESIMNSVITDLDHLAADDIAGATYLYGIKILSDGVVDGFVGQPLSFQLATNAPATSYEATNLPPGLSINSKTGLITGAVVLSGNYYDAELTVHGQKTIFSSGLYFYVAPDPPSADLRASFGLQANRLLLDGPRHRVYASLTGSNSIAVIDTISLSITQTIVLESEPIGMALSLDGKQLFVAQPRETDPIIGVIDLNTLKTLPSLPAPFQPLDIVAGSDGRLFVTGQVSIAQIDSATGAVLAPFPAESFDGTLVISPDLKTLFVGAVSYGPPSLFSVDVSSDAPFLLQQTSFNQFTGFIGDFKLSHDGTFLCVPGDAQGAVSRLLSDDITSTVGEYLLPDLNLDDGPFTGAAIALSPDDQTVFVTAAYFDGSATIDLFDAGTQQYLRKISAGVLTPSRLMTDDVGQYLFAISGKQGLASQLRVYSTGLASSPHPPKPKRLLNVSTRLKAAEGDDVLIGGFIVSGPDSKQVAIRAIGLSLPLPGSLADPVIALYDHDGKLVDFDDNWNDNRAGVLFTGLAPNDEHEAVVVATLSPGSYTAILQDAAGGSGIALVEVYDLTPDNDSTLANISTRGKVETEDNVMIGGFIISPEDVTKVLIRAIGPALTPLGVPGALQDPVLELHGSDGDLIFTNDNWRTTQESEIVASGLAPSDDRESAIVASLQPGGYTAIVRGQGSTTGVALVEVYNLDATTDGAR